MNIQEKTLPLPAALIQALRDTPQNPRYHAEGDVYTHTCMVLKAFQSHQAEWDLSQSESRILYWACVLHDVGKPAVTRWQTNRWTAKGHESAGVAPARDILLEQTDLSPIERGQVLDLVRWHHIPLQWGLKDRPFEDYQHLATQTDLGLLGKLARCDIEGRLCERKAEVLALIEHFNTQIVSRIDYEWGGATERKAFWEAAHPIHQNACWRALEMGDFARLGRLMTQKPAHSLPRASFRAYCTMSVDPNPATAWCKDEAPHGKYLNLREYLEQPKEKAEQEKAMRLILHFISVYGEAGNTLILDGLPTDEGLRRQITDHLRQQGAQTELLYFEQSRTSLPVSIDESTWKVQHASFMLPHPWEFHQIRYNKS